MGRAALDPPPVLALRNSPTDSAALPARGCRLDRDSDCTQPSATSRFLAPNCRGVACEISSIAPGKAIRLSTPPPGRRLGQNPRSNLGSPSSIACAPNDESHHSTGPRFHNHLVLEG